MGFILARKQPIIVGNCVVESLDLGFLLISPISLGSVEYMIFPDLEKSFSFISLKSLLNFCISFTLSVGRVSSAKEFPSFINIQRQGNFFAARR